MKGIRLDDCKAAADHSFTTRGKCFTKTEWNGWAPASDDGNPHSIFSAFPRVVQVSSSSAPFCISGEATGIAQSNFVVFLLSLDSHNVSQLLPLNWRTINLTLRRHIISRNSSRYQQIDFLKQLRIHDPSKWWIRTEHILFCSTTISRTDFSRVSSPLP